MTDSKITDSIVDDVMRELSILLPYRDVIYMYSYLENITGRKLFHLIKEYKKYRIVSNYSFTASSNHKIGSNMFVIILPLEGHVIITTLDIIENISGLSMWITNSQLREKILQFDIYNYDIGTELIKSPRIIVTDLPSHSLTLIKNTCPLTNDTGTGTDTETISIHELLMGGG